MMPTMLAMDGTGIAPDMTPIALVPMSSPTRATTIGRLIATIEPNAMARTTTATAMPITSLPGAASPLA